jgi:hypothetical protein
MRYEVTHLKAPWPDGVAVGDVVELDPVPAWALGKCKPAVDLVANVRPGEPESAPEAVEALEVPKVPAAEENAADPDPEPVAGASAGRAALEVEAKALGVSFNARTSDATLTERIAAAKA